MATPTELYINAELPKRPYTAQYPLTAGHVPVATGVGLEITARQLDVTDVANAASETYVNDAINALVDGAPAALDTLNELAAAINDDASYAATVTTALGNRLRVDVNTQGLTNTEKQNGLDNLGITEVITDASINASGLITFTKNTGQTADTVQIPTALNDLTFNSTTGVLTLKHTNNASDTNLTITSNEFADDVFRIKDNIDTTKKIAFEASGISTNTTRTITMPDANVDLNHMYIGASYNASTDTWTYNRADGTNDQIGIGFPADGTWYIKNTTDATKKIAFNAANISAGQRRVISMPDVNVDLNNTITGGSYSGGILTLNKPSGTHAISIPGSSGAISAQTNFTLSKNTRYLISSNSIFSTITLTMPASPSTGDWVEILAQSNVGPAKYLGGLTLTASPGTITTITGTGVTTYTLNGYAANALLVYFGGTWNLSITPNTSIYGHSHNVDETLATAAIAGTGHVVSGSNSAILSGSANQVTGTSSCILAGSSNIVSGNSAFIGGGLSNTANKQYSVILTGYSCLAAGTLSVILTGRGVQTTLGGAVIQGPYQTPANYVAAMIQNSILFGTTTNASTVQLDAAGGGSIANAGDTKILPAIAPVATIAGSPGGVGVHEIALTAKSTSGTFRAFSSTYHVTCSYDGSTYAIDGVTTLHSTSRSASTLSVAFSISGNQLIISCTNSDAVSNTISWVASVKSTYN